MRVGRPAHGDPVVRVSPGRSGVCSGQRQRQRVRVARALLDEATSALDPENARIVADAAVALARQGSENDCCGPSGRFPVPQLIGTVAGHLEVGDFDAADVGAAELLADAAGSEQPVVRADIRASTRSGLSDTEPGGSRTLPQRGRPRWGRAHAHQRFQHGEGGHRPPRHRPQRSSPHAERELSRPARSGGPKPTRGSPPPAGCARPPGTRRPPGRAPRPRSAR